MEQTEKKPLSDDEWTIHSLNIHGAFFQNRIAQIVNGYKSNLLSLVTTEYPVEYPPNREHNESRLDVLGFIKSTEQYDSGIYLVIECKKCNPEFVDWVFYPTLKSQLEKDEILRITFLRSITKVISNIGPNRTELTLTNPKNVDLRLSGDCRESRSSYMGSQNNDKKTKTSNTAIEEASSQVTLATHALATGHPN